MTRDPGLQPERAALAWSRTALAFLGSCVLFIHVAKDAAAADKALLLLIAAVAVTVVGAAVRRRRVVTDPARSPAAPSVALVHSITVVITLTGLCTLLLLL